MITLPAMARTRDAYRLTVAVTAAVAVASAMLVFLLVELAAPESVPDTGMMRLLVCAAGAAIAMAVTAPVSLLLSLALLRAHRLKEEAERLATTDLLTGLPNRAAVLVAIGEAIESCLAEQREGALLYIDLDHFKAINDHYGHLGGDVALQHAAAIMRETMAPGMVLGRFGGEEFVCFAPDAAQGAATAIAIIVSLRATSVNHYGSDINVTASIGIAVMGDARTPEALLANADRALYLAKSSGRDRIVHHDDIKILEDHSRRPARPKTASPVPEAA